MRELLAPSSLLSRIDTGAGETVLVVRLQRLLRRATGILNRALQIAEHA